MEDVIKWLRSPEGEDWTYKRTGKLAYQAGRQGLFGTVEKAEHPGDTCDLNCLSTRHRYRPASDAQVEYFVQRDSWIYEPETVEGLSSPA